MKENCFFQMYCCSCYNFHVHVPLQVVGTNPYTGSASTNYLSIYKVASGTSTATLMYGPIVVSTGAFGAIGGNSAGVHHFHSIQ